MRSLLFEIPIGSARIPIRSYGVMAAIGFLVALVVMRRLARKSNLSEQLAYDLWFAGFLGGFLGARIWYVIQFWSEQFAQDPKQVFAVTSGGLVWYGGVIGALVCIFAVARYRRQPLLRCFDLITPPGALGLAFGRVGCFFNGCCFGGVSNVPWAVRFPKGSPAYLHQLYTHQIEPDAACSLPVHPTQLYSCVCSLVLFVVVYHYYFKRKHPGQVLALWLLLYAPVRVFLEWLRDDIQPGLLGMTPAQLLGIVAAIAAGVAFVVLQKKPGRTPVVLPDGRKESPREKKKA